MKDDIVIGEGRLCVIDDKIVLFYIYNMEKDITWAKLCDGLCVVIDKEHTVKYPIQ